MTDIITEYAVTNKSVSKLEGAQSMGKRGFQIFLVTSSTKQKDGTYLCSCGSLECENHGKHPLRGSHGFKDSTDNLELIELAFMNTPDANYGVRPSKTKIVIDIDRKAFDENGEMIDGLTNLAEFMGISENEVLSLTYTAKTPTGGYHLYFSCNEDDGFSNRVGVLPGIDVRSNDGYVVGPGSMIRGNFYEDFNDLDIQPIPNNLRTLMTQTSQRDPKWEEPLFDWDHPMAIERVQQLFKNRKPAIEGKGGDNWTIKTAALARDHAVSEEKCFEIMTEDGGWNERCCPAWGDEELTQKVRNAYAYAKGRPGNRGGGQMFDSIETDDAPVQKLSDNQITERLKTLEKEIHNHQSEFETISGFEPMGKLVQTQPPCVYDIADGLIEKSILTTFTGPGGSRKSTLMLQLCVCLDAQKPFIGTKVLSDVTPVYISCEDDRHEINRRLQRIMETLDVTDLDCAVFADRTSKNSTLVQIGEDGKHEILPYALELIDSLKAIKGHKLLVLDSLYDFVGWSGQSKINEDSVRWFLRVFMGFLGRECNATIIPIMHPSRAGTERSGQGSFSVAFDNVPRGRITIKRKSDTEDQYDFGVPKRSHKKDGFTLDLAVEYGAFFDRTLIKGSQEEIDFLNAIVKYAAQKAEQGVPFSKRKTSINDQDLKELKAEKINPTIQQVQETLKHACEQKRLMYVKSTPNVVAGYYPLNNDSKEAADKAIGMATHARNKKKRRGK